MHFAYMLIEAFESGHVDSADITLGEIYTTARHHVADNYQFTAAKLEALVGEPIARQCCQGRTAEQDAKVIEQLIEHQSCLSRHGFVLPGKGDLQRYADQLHQQAQEVQP